MKEIKIDKIQILLGKCVSESHAIYQPCFEVPNKNSELHMPQLKLEKDKF